MFISLLERFEVLFVLSVFNHLNIILVYLFFHI